MDYYKSQWATYSSDLPDPVEKKWLLKVVKSIPKHILRMKSCTRLDEDETYSYFESNPLRVVFIRPYNRVAFTSGPKLLTIDLCSDPEQVFKIIKQPRVFNFSYF